MLDAVFDMALLNLMKQAGITDALKKIVLGGGSVTVDAEFLGEGAKDCVCGGECACHNGTQFLRVPHPPECQASGFDLCHRCDCGARGADPQAVKGMW
jgi:hypothetical protein